MRLKQTQATVRNKRSPFCMYIYVVETGVNRWTWLADGNCVALQPALSILFCICMSTFGSGRSISSSFLFFFLPLLWSLNPSCRTIGSGMQDAVGQSVVGRRGNEMESIRQEPPYHIGVSPTGRYVKLLCTRSHFILLLLLWKYIHI